MFGKRFSHRSGLSIVLVMMTLFAFWVLPGSAQNATPIQYGSVLTGNLPEGGTIFFNFTANPGDLVAVRVIGLTPGMDPNVTLFGPQQELVAVNDNEFVDFPTTAAALVYRVAVTGTYTIAVSGTPGDFLLTLDALLVPTFSLIELDTPLQLTLPIPENVQVFAFNTDPFAATTVHLDANPADLDAFVTIRDGSGQTAASLQGSLDNACISFGPSDELLELRIAVTPETAGTISVTLGRGPCQIGPAPATVEQPAVQVPPIPIEGVCAATSVNNMNIRSGPGTAFPVLTLWLARQPIQVIGRSDDGQWLAVQTATLQGWIALPLVALVGPCDPLAVLAAPALPATTPTPGFPASTATPMATLPSGTPISLTETGTTPITATVGATQGTTPGVTTTTVPPEASATLLPTIEVTPEVTEVTG